MRLWLFLFSLIFVSAFLTWVLIRVARKQSIMDIPNHRSSHSVPTPRGGGAALIITFLIGLAAIYVKAVVSDPVFMALLIGGGMIAFAGWLDDKHGVAAKWRLVVHIIAAVIALFILKNLPEMPFQKQFPNLQYLGFLIALLAIVWSTNLFNFMDGINGLAGMEAAFVSGSAAFILYLNDQLFHAASLLVLCFSAVGFLLFNFPKARIFMGDVGSGFLGFLTAVYAIGVSFDDGISPWSWLILYGCFFVDSTITLLTRMFTGQQWLKAHNLHAYQKLTRELGSHTKVTLLIMGVNLVWLFPWAVAATVYNEQSLWITSVSLLPVVFIVLKLKAGRVE